MDFKKYLKKLTRRFLRKYFFVQDSGPVQKNIYVKNGVEVFRQKIYLI